MVMHQAARIGTLVAVLATSVGYAAEQETWQPPAPLSPQASRDAIVVPEGFTVELIAAEPLVMDPVSFAWGLDGRLWVVEMPDYNWLPINDTSPDKPRGRVIFLTDSDGDGKYDKRTVFLDDLHYPTSVLPWRSGILVTAAPDILYAEDTTPKDDNHKADKREILYTGFGEGNPQLRVNGLQWGLDNWIYCANGWSHGVIKSTKTGKTLDIRGRDLRIRPDTGEIEPASGVSQYGRVRDDYGNWFGVDNSRLIIHYVFEDHHLRRNPHVAAPEPFIDLVMPKNPPCYPLGRKVERLHAPYMANRFTSACGIAVYRDSLIKEFKDNIFVCEPVHNLVTRRVLTPDGVTFKAERIKSEEQSEFLASTDEWFRPVHARTGPDGALWIADMYRAVIEHPQWLPKDFNKKVDWMQGSEKGRIYRVFRKDAKPRTFERLDEVTPEALADKLDTPNGTQRDLVHLMLVSKDREEVARLTALKKSLENPPNRLDGPQWDKAMDQVEKGRLARLVVNALVRKRLQRLLLDRESSVVGRIQALSTLHGMELLESADLSALVASEDPHLSLPAVRLSGDMDEKRLPGALMIAATSNRQRTPRMDFHVAQMLGYYTDSSAGKLLANIGARNSNDPWVLSAVTSSLQPHLYAVTQSLMDWKDCPSSFIDAIAATAVANEDQATLTLLIRSACNGPMEQLQRRMEIMAGIVDALLAKGSSLAKLHEKAEDPLRLEIAGSDVFFLEMERRLADHELMDKTELALRLLGQGHRSRKGPAATLVELIERNRSGDFQMAGVAVLIRSGEPHWLGRFTRFDEMVPRALDVILQAAFRRDTLIHDLLDHIERKRLQTNLLTAAQRQLLLQHKDEKIRGRAVQLLGQITSDRAKIVDDHRDALSLAPDHERGRDIFAKTCAACHRISGIGKGYGPDLGSLTDRAPATMLEAILDPNRSVDPRYINYIVQTHEGDTYTGILLSESGSTIALGMADGNKQLVLRKDVESMRALKLSLMPEGLEQSLGKHGLADVIAYVISASQPRRVIAAMKPATIKADRSGAFVLPVTQGEAFGSKIDYEKEDNNIGSWTQREDYLAWLIDVDSGGRYEIWFDYGADAKWTGNKAILICEDETGDLWNEKMDITPTSTKDDYQQKNMGEITLVRGKQRVLLKADGAITGELMHLRGLRLAPKK